jgi:ABC-type transport system involved in multi-copper enzyme maturation permease subunit
MQNRDTMQNALAATQSRAAFTTVDSVENSRSSKPGRIYAIARNTFREALRDRVLYNLVLFVLILTGASIFIGELSASQESKIIVDLGLSSLLIFGVFIATFVGVGLVFKEIERRTVYAIFAKPVTRTEFIVGKYLGLCLTLLVNVVVMGAGISLALLYVQQTKSISAIAMIWPAIFLIYLELAIVVAVALLFSSFSSPALSALLTFFVFLIGNFSADLKSFANSFGGKGTKLFCSVLYYMLPNLANFSYITETAHGRHPETAAILMGALYAIIYIVILLSLSSVILNQRNFK